MFINVTQTTTTRVHVGTGQSVVFTWYVLHAVGLMTEGWSRVVTGGRGGREVLGYWEDSHGIGARAPLLLCGLLLQSCFHQPPPLSASNRVGFPCRLELGCWGDSHCVGCPRSVLSWVPPGPDLRSTVHPIVVSVVFVPGRCGP